MVKTDLICSLCNSKNISKKFTIKNFSEPFDIYECNDCKFQFQTIPIEKLHSFYNENYYSGKANYSYVDERKIYNASCYVWKKRAKILIKFDKSSGKKTFLDIGCAFGGLMSVFKKYNYDVYGVEISKEGYEYLINNYEKDHIFNTPIEDLSLQKDFFSIITMIELIEHIYNPLNVLQKIYDSLKHGGVLLIQTADMAGLQAKIYKDKYHYYLPGHISYFTKKNLIDSLKKVGFKKIKFYGGVEFGLLPKIQKSIALFNKPSDYLKLIRITLYHFLSKINIFDIHLTSSMVIIAWKE